MDRPATYHEGIEQRIEGLADPRLKSILKVCMAHLNDSAMEILLDAAQKDD